jgi:DNA-binding Lrp family transcriptional regulator
MSSWNITPGFALCACFLSDKSALLWHFLRSFFFFTQLSAALMDRLDRSILEALQTDGRMSNKQLAKQVHLSESACLRRVRALEEEGMIERYVAMVNQAKAGMPGDVLVHIGLHREEQSELAAFEEAVRNIPEVMECYLMTGEFDYLLRVVVADMADFERIHKEELTRLPGVARVNSSVAIRTVLKRTAVPLR